MDKYDGIIRPETISIPIVYKTKPRGVAGRPDKITSEISEGRSGEAERFNSEKKSRSKYKLYFTAARYILCLLLITVCLLGKFTDIGPAAEASSFIKTELSRDAAKEIVIFSGKNSRLIPAFVRRSAFRVPLYFYA